MDSRKQIVKDTFLRYNNPVVVSRHSQEQESPFAVKSRNQEISGKSKTDLSILRVDKNQSIEDVLNCIFPPKEWEENGKRWVQTVASEPVTIEDVRDLEEKLDTSLRKEGAKETGICPIRRKLFDQCFDELLRQEAVNCCERGILLRLVRDNLRMELNTLERLYESSIAYGLRKTLLVEEKKIANTESIAAEKEKKKALEEEIKELNMRMELTEMKEAEQRAAAEEEHRKEVEILKQEKNSLKEMLEKTIYPKK